MKSQQMVCCSQWYEKNRKEDKMKTLKWKWLVAAGVICFVLTSAVPPGKNKPGTNNNTSNKTVAENSMAPASSPNGRFEKENMDIRSDISSMTMHKERVQAMKDQLKADKEADRKMDVLRDKKELEKAKAELKRDKSFLSSDKRDLKCDHQLVINERRKEIRNQKNAVADSKKDLDKAIANGDETRAQEYTAKTVRLQKEVNSSEAALERDKKDMDDNMMAVNKAIKSSEEKSEKAVASGSSSHTSSNSR